MTNNRNYPPLGLVEGSASHSNAVVKNIFRLGGSAWRMEVRPGDPTVPYGSYRAELTVTTKGNANNFRSNAYSLSSYIPSGTWATSSQEEIFPFQFHPWASNNNGGSPSLAIEIQNDAWQVVIRHTVGGRETRVPFKKEKVQRDVWIDWIVYYQPHTTSGRVIIWRRIVGVDANYKIWFEYTGPCLHSWSEYPFLKTGIYWWNRPSSGAANMARVGYIDEIAHGVSTPEQIVNEFRIGQPPVPVNNPPVANAGPDQVLAEGATSTTLNGEATDPDTGELLSPTWKQIEGEPAVFIEYTWNPEVSGLKPGNNIFRLTVTDSKGAQHSDDVLIIVPEIVVPEPPKVLFTWNDVVAGKIIQLLENGTWVQV